MQKPFLIKATLVLLLLVLLFGVLYVAKPILMPLALAAVLTMLFMPFAQWLEKKHVSRVIAAVICVLAFACIVTGILMLLSTQFTTVTENLAAIRRNVFHALYNMNRYLNKSLGVSAPATVKTFNPDNETTNIDTSVTELIGSVVAIVINSILIIVYMVLMMYYRSHFKNFILKLVKPADKAKTAKVLHQSVKVVQQYLFGLTIIIFMLWIMYGIGFSLIGIKNALFFAFLCGLLELVPFVGNITGSTLTGLMAFSQGGGFPMVLDVLITYAIVQFIQFYIIAPIVMGAQVRINPLFTILIIIAGELLWGVPGMFLSIPALAITRTVFDNVEALKPFGYLIGQERKHTAIFQKIRGRLGKKNHLNRQKVKQEAGRPVPPLDQ